MTDASSDSDEGGAGGRAQDWEVVSLSALSMSGSSAAPGGVWASGVDERAGGARSPDSADGPPAALVSDHFGVGDRGSVAGGADSLLMDRYLGGQGRPATGEEFRENPNNGGEEGKKEGANSTTSKADDCAEADWIEPAPPATDELMREESNSGSQGSAGGEDDAEKKASESDGKDAATGPLLGSCMSAGGKIVSSAGAFRAGLGDEVVQSSSKAGAGGEGAMAASTCAAEEELAGLEREILGPESGFGSFREEPRVDMKELEERCRRPGDLTGELTDALLGGAGEEDEDDDDEQASCEVWWKRRVAFWFMEAPQANTFWSLALAAAVMGLVILGQRWQQERIKNSFLRSQLGSRDEKISQLIYQVARLKDALSGRRRVPVLRTSATYGTVHSRF